MTPREQFAAVVGRTLAPRSTILRPLAWMAWLSAGALVGTLRFEAPVWLTVFLSVCLGLTVFLYLGSFVYCLLTDKEALRSEDYSIQKLEIERGEGRPPQSTKQRELEN